MVDWIEEYYKTIEKLKEIRPYGIFGKLKINKYYKNSKNPPYGWLFNRHHIEEIDISGSELEKDIERYKKGTAIIVKTNEHLLLHYIIICAKTTNPNHGMLIPIVRSGISKAEAIVKWDRKMRYMTGFFDVPFNEDWYMNLSLPEKDLLEAQQLIKGEKTT